MSFNSFVKSILDPIGVPVAYATYTGTASEYIIFNEWNIPGLHADDKESQTNHTVQIDIFAKGNFIQLADEVRSRMIAAGFMKIFEDPAEYIDNTKMYRKILRFSYTKEVERYDL